MPDHKEPNARGLFGGVFARGGVAAGRHRVAAGDAGRRGGPGPGARASRAGAGGLGRGGHRDGEGRELRPERARRTRRADREPGARAGPRAGPSGAPDRGQRRASRGHQPGHRGHRRDAARQAGHRRHPGRPGPGGRGRGRAGRGAPGLDHDRPHAAPAGRSRDLRPGRGGLADQRGRGPRGAGGRRARRLAVQFGGAAGTLASLGDAGQRVAALLADGTRPGGARAALAHGPAADHRPGRRAGPGGGRARQDRQGRHPAGPVGGR